jgi:hypothetical protein
MYWIEVREAALLLGAMLMTAALIGVALVKLADAPWINVAIVCAAVIAPPILMFWPDYPTEGDVERDRMVRRSAALNDDVEAD